MNLNLKHPTVNILLAEDDEDDVAIFHEALSEIGREVRLSIAKNGVKCIEQLKHPGSYPDIIFLDINMPLKNGFQCLEEIRRQESLKNVKVVMLSTSNHDDIINLAFEKGADDFISKSKNFPDLRSCIAASISTIEKYNHA